MSYMDGRGSPNIYSKWAAIFIIGAVLERKIWIQTSKSRTYPNHFITLVGPAGVGKSVVTNVIQELIDAIRGPDYPSKSPIHLAPSSVTRASIIDALNDAERRIIRPMDTPSLISYNSLAIIANELGVFLPGWDTDFMSTLTDLWDNKHYSETRRTSKLNISIPRVQLNLLSATTPAHLKNFLPEGAWEQGFMSRMLCIYSGEIIHTDIFAKVGKDKNEWDMLVADLYTMFKLYGEIKVEEDVQLAVNAWARSGGTPAPTHPNLLSYNARRLHHLLKLCIISCISEGDILIVTLDHYARALDWLVEAEAFMPDIFKSIKTGGDAKAMEECWHFVYGEYIRNSNKAVPEYLVFNFLAERVPAHSVERVLDVMCRAKLLNKKFLGDGSQGYEPKAR